MSRRIMKTYRLPTRLNNFQRKIYKHLIDWKCKNITTDPGYFKDNPYDAILPEEFVGKFPHIYPPIIPMLQKHKFKFHKFFNHMVSSQAACINLFLPLMQYPDKAAEVLRAVKKDLVRIDTDTLDNGFQLEFWDKETKLLNDHTVAAGTDADIAIAYYTNKEETRLWLIEHKLSESEFTTCGGAKSKGRKNGNYSCDSIADILENPGLCYYHGGCGYKYWDIMLDHPDVFLVENMVSHGSCPFIGGLNQLWRNMLLALAIENSSEWPFERVYFSVVHHPGNTYLKSSTDDFISLIGCKERFFSFTSDIVVNAAQGEFGEWVKWYRELYL